jgi:hypothetical protein
MNEAQNTKVVAVCHPAAIRDNSAFTTISIDTKGFEYCQILVHIGFSDIAMMALKVQESDDDGSADAYADIPGLDFDGDTEIDGTAAVLPTADDDNKVFIFEIDLRGRERYLDLVATAGDGSTGTFLSAIAILSRAKQVPVTVAGRGAGGVLRA